jgi:hypothetical protein
MIEDAGYDESGQWLFYGVSGSVNECWYLVPYSWECVQPPPW